MFSDAFGKKDFLSDERHGAGVRCLRGNVTSKNFMLWKSNKKVLQCQRNSEYSRRKCRRDLARCCVISLGKQRVRRECQDGACVEVHRLPSPGRIRTLVPSRVGSFTYLVSRVTKPQRIIWRWRAGEALRGACRA